MPSRGEHALIGFVFGAGAYALVKHLQNEEINPAYALGWGCVGAGVALVPDILEPASTPLHRGVVHSAAMGAVVLYGTKKALDSQELTPECKAASASVAAAFLSHLLADSMTPAGIPLIR